MEIYTFNSTIHGVSTRSKLQLHKPSSTLTVYQEGAYCDSIKIFNILPKCTAESVVRKNVLYQI
jgi:hypothetical protein